MEFFIKIYPTNNYNFEIIKLVDDFWLFNKEVFNNYFNNQDLPYLKYQVFEKNLYIDFEKYPDGYILNLTYFEESGEHIPLGYPFIFQICKSYHSSDWIKYNGDEAFSVLEDYEIKKEYYDKLKENFLSQNYFYTISFIVSDGDNIKIGEMVLCLSYIISKLVNGIIECGDGNLKVVETNKRLYFHDKVWNSEQYLVVLKKYIGKGIS